MSLESDEAHDAREFTGGKRVRCRCCGHKFTAWNEADVEHLQRYGCTNCARDKMRSDALRDRRPFRDG